MICSKEFFKKYFLNPESPFCFKESVIKQIEQENIMGKIAKKVLKWREKQPTGAIMTPEKFESIKKGVARSGSAKDAQAVAGSKYWDEVMQKYSKRHCPAKPL